MLEKIKCKKGNRLILSNIVKLYLMSNNKLNLKSNFNVIYVNNVNFRYNFIEAINNNCIFSFVESKILLEFYYYYDVEKNILYITLNSMDDEILCYNCGDIIVNYGCYICNGKGYIKIR